MLVEFYRENTFTGRDQGIGVQAVPEVVIILHAVRQGNIQSALLLACWEVVGGMHAQSEHLWTVLKADCRPISLHTRTHPTFIL